MLAAIYRFHGHGSLGYLYRNGRAIRSRCLTVKYIANPRRKCPRFAVVVSKKIYKSAVRRNRIRRRIYECIRRELPNLSNAGDLAVIVTNAEVLTMPAAELDSLVVQLLRQACPQYMERNR